MRYTEGCVQKQLLFIISVNPQRLGDFFKCSAVDTSGQQSKTYGTLYVR